MHDVVEQLAAAVSVASILICARVDEQMYSKQFEITGKFNYFYVPDELHDHEYVGGRVYQLVQPYDVGVAHPLKDASFQISWK